MAREVLEAAREKSREMTPYLTHARVLADGAENLTEGIEDFIQAVETIAKEHFGSGQMDDLEEYLEQTFGLPAATSGSAI